MRNAAHENRLLQIKIGLPYAKTTIIAPTLSWNIIVCTWSYLWISCSSFS